MNVYVFWLKLILFYLKHSIACVFWSKKIWYSAWNWNGRVAYIKESEYVDPTVAEKWNQFILSWIFFIIIIIIPRRHMFIQIECSFDAVDFRFVCCVFSVFPVHHDSQEWAMVCYVCVCGFMEPSCDFTYMQCGHHEHALKYQIEVGHFSSILQSHLRTQRSSYFAVLLQPFIMIYDEQSQKRHRFFFFPLSVGSSFCDASFRVRAQALCIIKNDIPLRSSSINIIIDIFFRFIIASDAQCFFSFFVLFLGCTNDLLMILCLYIFRFDSPGVVFSVFYFHSTSNFIYL